jgi:hypothetical protein
VGQPRPSLRQPEGGGRCGRGAPVPGAGEAARGGIAVAYCGFAEPTRSTSEDLPVDVLRISIDGEEMGSNHDNRRLGSNNGSGSLRH